MEKITHVLEAQQFDKSRLENELFPLVQQMERRVEFGGSNDLAGKRMITFFYEPSTRTRLSFEMAMDMLAGRVVFSTENAKQFSSVAKGETIEDTVRILCNYKPDIIVLRTDEEGMAKKAAELSTVPIINAGDGTGQHPTQALLDIYTILKELGGIDGISVAICGDLARGRTARSLAYLLAKWQVKIYFVSPKVVRMHNDIKEYLTQHKVPYQETEELRDVVQEVNVVYQTRIQKERGENILKFGGKTPVIDKEIMALLKKDAIVMHPLPRVNELSPEIDDDPRAAYFRQAENGLYVRMALLKMILS